MKLDFIYNFLGFFKQSIKIFDATGTKTVMMEQTKRNALVGNILKYTFTVCKIPIAFLLNENYTYS